ncbi:hypothetical protein [Nocardia sp. GAS34]
MQVSDLRKFGHVVLDNRPCKITDKATPTT